MVNYSNSFKHQIDKSIKAINSQNLEQETKLRAINIALEKHIVDMNNWLKDYTFSSQAEEIYFFKHLRPQIISKLFYYKTLLRWEATVLPDPELKKEFYLEKYSKIEQKLERLGYIDEYCNMNNSYNDTTYFIRHHNLSAVAIYTSEYVNYDSRLCTSQSIAVSKILYYRMLINYLTSKLQCENNHSQNNSQKLKWNYNTQNLYELIFALYHAKAFGDEKTPLSKITEVFEDITGVDLVGNLYKRWGSHKNLKKDNVSFMKTLASALENAIEEAKSK